MRNIILYSGKGVAKSMLKGIANIMMDRNKKVRIKKNLYMKLIEEVGADEEDIDFLVNKIISERFDRLEKKLIANQEAEIHEENLADYYIALEKYLIAALDNNVLIGITNGLIGKEGAKDYYTLIDYKMSYTYKYITLKLEKDEEIYPITFKGIKDIKFSDRGDMLKTWIYMTDETWRFYLYYDKKILLGNIEDEKTSSDQTEDISK